MKKSPQKQTNSKQLIDHISVKSKVGSILKCGYTLKTTDKKIKGLKYENVSIMVKGREKKIMVGFDVDRKTAYIRKDIYTEDVIKIVKEAIL